MRNIKLTIEYDGTNYCGWQIQNSSPQSLPCRQAGTVHSPRNSIQETIEKVLSKVLQEKIRLIASGRTDTGVHALAQVANFKTSSLVTLEKLQRALNGLLSKDIVVNKAEEVPLDFHSRFDVKSKVYRYTVLNRLHPSALCRNTVYFYPYRLNVTLMQKEARCLLGKHDFKAFCASGSAAKSTIRRIKAISIKKKYYPLYAKRYPLVVIDIEANGFLYNMVRNIVGTFIDISRGKLPPGSMKRILSSRDRKKAGATAASCGLCLLGVNY